MFVSLHATSFGRVLRSTLNHLPHGSSVPRPGFGVEILAFCGLALTTYLAFALPGVWIANKTGSRLIWAAPVVLLIAWKLEPLADYYQSWPVPNGVAALVDLAAILLPGSVAAARAKRRVRSADANQRWAFTTVAVVAAFVYLVMAYRSTGSFDVNVDANGYLLVLFLTGAALGTRRPWWPWAQIALVVLFSQLYFGLVDHALGFEGLSMAGTIWAGVMSAMPGAVAVALGAMADPLAGYFRWRRAQSVPAGRRVMTASTSP